MTLEKLKEENTRLATLINEFQETIKARETEVAEMDDEIASDTKEAGSYLALELAASQGIEPVKMAIEDEKEGLPYMSRAQAIEVWEQRFKREMNTGRVLK